MCTNWLRLLAKYLEVGVNLTSVIITLWSFVLIISAPENNLHMMCIFCLFSEKNNNLLQYCWQTKESWLKYYYTVLVCAVNFLLNYVPMPSNMFYVKKKCHKWLLTVVKED